MHVNFVAERELVLVKVRAPPGPARTEITQLAQIFRAHIIDVGEATFTMSVTGDPGKVRPGRVCSSIFECCGKG